MLAAEKLDYGSVIEALEKGYFYSAAKVNAGAPGDCPEIRNLYIEDGVLFVETSPAANIAVVKDLRPFFNKVAKPGEPVTSASFKLGDFKWFRVVVTGPNGCKAYSNAYFSDTL